MRGTIVASRCLASVCKDGRYTSMLLRNKRSSYSSSRFYFSPHFLLSSSSRKRFTPNEVLDKSWSRVVSASPAPSPTEVLTFKFIAHLLGFIQHSFPLLVDFRRDYGKLALPPARSVQPTPALASTFADGRTHTKREGTVSTLS